MNNDHELQVRTFGQLSYIEQDGHIEICEPKDKDCMEIVIPEFIEGLPVKIIRENAFKKCYSLRSVNIPEGITEICDMAFMECSDLRCIRLPKALKTLGAGVFAGCYNILYIKLPDTIKAIPQKGGNDHE